MVLVCLCSSYEMVLKARKYIKKRDSFLIYSYGIPRALTIVCSALVRTFCLHHGMIAGICKRGRDHVVRQEATYNELISWELTKISRELISLL